MKYTMYIFEDFGKFYLVEVTEDGRATLKIKEDGWHDTWSPALHPQRVSEGEYAKA